MDIRRIDSYADDRFSGTTLRQHGAYLVNGLPVSFIILENRTAVIQGAFDQAVLPELIETFRFHAPHITCFLDESGKVLANEPEAKILTVNLNRIQPSQFFVDTEKLDAIRSWVHRPEDIVVQVLPWKDRWICLDGHTRLYLAVQMGFQQVNAVVSETDDWIWTFVEEAQKRGIHDPGSLVLLSHAEYEQKWNAYCDAVFSRGTGSLS